MEKIIVLRGEVKRMQSAEEFCLSEDVINVKSKYYDTLEWFDFAERYADYVCNYEKLVGRSSEISKS